MTGADFTLLLFFPAAASCLAMALPIAPVAVLLGCPSGGIMFRCCKHSHVLEMVNILGELE